VQDSKGPLVEDLVRKHQPRTVLELGVYVGYGATTIARHLPKDSLHVSVRTEVLFMPEMMHIVWLGAAYKSYARGWISAASHRGGHGCIIGLTCILTTFPPDRVLAVLRGDRDQNGGVGGAGGPGQGGDRALHHHHPQAQGQVGRSSPRNLRLESPYKKIPIVGLGSSVAG
jgi:hypothetical protein